MKEDVEMDVCRIGDESVEMDVCRIGDERIRGC